MAPRSSAASAASIVTRIGRVASFSSAAPARSGIPAASTIPRNMIACSSIDPGTGMNSNIW